MIRTHCTIAEAVDQLKREEKNRFTVLMEYGKMSLEYYAPRDMDLQQPHNQDELYVIASGQGTFFCNEEQYACKPGDVLFVPAGAHHRFENFSDDFATWVIFFGPRGGSLSDQVF